MKSHTTQRGIKSITSKYLILICISIMPLAVFSQATTVKYEAGIAAVASSGKYAPFWLQSNQYGKIVSSPTSGLMFGVIEKQFDKPHKLFDYAFKGNVLLRYYMNNDKKELFFQELFAKARFSVFNLTIGSREQIFGNQDSTLSSGGLLFSKNTRPMPEISAGIEHFTSVPFTSDFIEIKGGVRHGWFTDNIYTKGILLHHKFGYVRIGGNLPFHLEYGIEHAAQWGGTDPVYGASPVNMENLMRVFFAKSGGKDATVSDQINVLGNHIISQGLKAELNVAEMTFSGYWQNLSEDPPVMFIALNRMNRPDGLWGISLKNRLTPCIKGILYEYLNTTDQAGPYHDKDGLIYGGADNYFRGAYPEGWSYYSRTIGTPFITSPYYNQNGNLSTRNNRVRLHHFGVEGSIGGFDYRALASFGRNYGTIGSQTDIPNKSFLLEINKHVTWLSGLDLSFSAGSDAGEFYSNSTGILFKVRKKGILFKYE